MPGPWFAQATPDPSWLFDQITGRLGGFFAICLFVVAVFRKWVVIGWTYKDMREDRDMWRELALSGTKLASRALDVIKK